MDNELYCNRGRNASFLKFQELLQYTLMKKNNGQFSQTLNQDETNLQEPNTISRNVFKANSINTDGMNGQPNEMNIDLSNLKPLLSESPALGENIIGNQTPSKSKKTIIGSSKQKHALDQSTNSFREKIKQSYNKILKKSNSGYSRLNRMSCFSKVPIEMDKEEKQNYMVIKIINALLNPKLLIDQKGKISYVKNNLSEDIYQNTNILALLNSSTINEPCSNEKASMLFEILLAI